MLAAIWLAAALALPGDSLCERAEYIMHNRHREPAWFDSCSAILARCTGTRRLTLRAEALITIGESETGRADKMRWYVAARAAAESLRAADDRDPYGFVWWAAAQGRILQMRGMVVAVAGAADLRRANERALELDPDCALASFALGRMQEELPGLLGGGPKKAEAWYRRGVASDPNYTIIRLALARALAGQRRREEALAELTRLLAVENPTSPAEAELYDRPAALELRARLQSGGRNP